VANRFYVVATLSVRSGEIARFEMYERQALGIAARHGGTLEQAIRSEVRDGACTEVHVLSFPTPAAFASFRADADIVALVMLRDAVIAKTEVTSGSQVSAYEN
jgi:hypothetical protein